MIHADDYRNTISGIGTGRAKSSATVIVERPPLTPSELNVLYEQEGMAARIVDRVVDDATREDIEIETADKAYDWKSVASDLEDLDAVNKLGDGWRWARLYGGALVIMVVNDAAALDQPLQLERASRIESLQVIESTYVTPSTFRARLGTDAFRRPEFFEIQAPAGAGVAAGKIHHTRCIRFDGVKVAPSRLLERNGWGPSVLQRPYVELLRLGTAMGFAGEILHELTLLVLRMKGFSDAMKSTESRAELQQAFQTMRDTMNSLGLLVLDSEDDLAEHARSVQGVDALVGRFVDSLVRAQDMPRTILLGEQPGGLNANADSEVRGWFDHVAVQQRKKLTPAMTRLLTVLLALRRKRDPNVPKEWTVKYASLWQPSEKEKADTKLVNAQADSALIDVAVTTAEEVRQRMVGAGEITPLVGPPATAGGSLGT